MARDVGPLPLELQLMAESDGRSSANNDGR